MSIHKFTTCGCTDVQGGISEQVVLYADHLAALERASEAFQEILEALKDLYRIESKAARAKGEEWWLVTAPDGVNHLTKGPITLGPSMGYDVRKVRVVDVDEIPAPGEVGK